MDFKSVWPKHRQEFKCASGCSNEIGFQYIASWSLEGQRGKGVFLLKLQKWKTKWLIQQTNWCNRRTVLLQKNKRKILNRVDLKPYYHRTEPSTFNLLFSSLRIIIFGNNGKSYNPMPANSPTDSDRNENPLCSSVSVGKTEPIFSRMAIGVSFSFIIPVHRWSSVNWKITMRIRHANIDAINSLFVRYEYYVFQSFRCFSLRGRNYCCRCAVCVFVYKFRNFSLDPLHNEKSGNSTNDESTLWKEFSFDPYVIESTCIGIDSICPLNHLNDFLALRTTHSRTTVHQQQHQQQPPAATTMCLCGSQM